MTSPRMMVLLSLALSACQLTPFYSDQPTRCRSGESREVPCGPCDDGERIEVCGDDDRWSALGRCLDNPWDLDGDGYAGRECYELGRDCCGQTEDCNDHDVTRWSGHADLDGDDIDDAHCGGDDCNDDDSSRWRGHADLDGDGHDDSACGGDDCNDEDPLRWSGHADLDGDGFDALSCGGRDCNDDDRLRWSGQADLDGDGYEDHLCCDLQGRCGDDCNDEDPDRWIGHADLDDDGYDDSACGGDDCDDDCQRCHPGSSPSCQRSRDHDCDGRVDELQGCGICLFGEVYPVTAQPLGTGPSRAVAVSVAGAIHEVYVASREGLYLVSVLDGASAEVFGPVDVGDAWDVFVAREFAYVATAWGLYVVDFRLRERPVILAGPVATGDSRGVFVQGPFAYVASSTGLFVVDVSLPRAPSVVAEVILPGETDDSREVVLVGQYAYVAHYSVACTPDNCHSVYIVDVEEPRAPAFVRQNQSLAAVTIFADETRLFVGGWSPSFASRRGLDVLSLAWPRNPTSMSTYRLGNTYGVFHSAGVIATATDSGVRLAEIDAQGRGRFDVVVDTGLTRAVYMADGYLYAATDSGLYILDLGCEPAPSER